MKTRKTPVLALLLAVCMLFSMSTGVLAAFDFDLTTSASNDGYYQLISKEDYDIAPGITESEIVINCDDQSQRQVLHFMEADISNEYAKVIGTYTDMDGVTPIAKEDYAVSDMMLQANAIESNMGYNVVGIMNTCLSWYNTAVYAQDPSRMYEPLGVLVVDGNVLSETAVGFPVCLVIHYDELDGAARPDTIPKVEMRTVNTSADLNGWEEQVIPVSSSYIVENGKNKQSATHVINNSNCAPRSVVGIKADGTVVIMMNDGRQAPYSTGMNMYECAEAMIAAGCVKAVNCDGGGSSTFLSQRPGRDLEVNCSPSEGGLRPSTHGIAFISTAPATGEFVRANITAEHAYYIPGSTVTFSALGTDLVGTAAEIPAEATWTLSEDSAHMGTIADGVFVSNGTVGTVTAQMVYNGAVVGSASTEIVVPTAFSFRQKVMTVEFGTEVTISFSATINDGLIDVAFADSAITLANDNAALGTFTGLSFAAVTEENAPENLKSTATAVLDCGEVTLTATAALNLGKGSVIIEDFEDGVDDWCVGEVNKYNIHDFSISAADAQDGQVYDGEGSMRFHYNGLTAYHADAGGYAQMAVYPKEDIIIENALSLGFWVYLPDEFSGMWIRVHYYYEGADGTYAKKNTVSVLPILTVYDSVEESAWYYYSVDVSAYNSVMIKGDDGTADAAKNCRFIEINNPHCSANDTLKGIGTINGNYNVYIDNITADFSEAVADREKPIFSDVALVNVDETTTSLPYRGSLVTTASSTVSLTASVAENVTKDNATGLDTASAKAYVDGVAVECGYAGGRITVNNLTLNDGVHRIKFVISDLAGNSATVVRMFEVASGTSVAAVSIVPKDATLDRLYGGSIYWMDVNAAAIESVQSVTAIVDINTSNHWQLDHMEVADGFTATYTLFEETDTATITITRTGKNTQTGAATLASLPIRIISYENDIFDADRDWTETPDAYWDNYNFWPQDLKVDVDLGVVTFVDGTTATFSNEAFSVDTEMYTSGLATDATYRAEHTAHSHTASAVADCAATCTESGYTGRTYCEVCSSVVDWGTTVAAKGHAFGTEDGLHTCSDCSDTLYLVDGVAQKGWIETDGKYYYFDEDAVAVDGSATIDGKTYGFVNKVLTEAAWINDGAGLIGYWAGETLPAGWNTINGKRYFITGFYANTGIAKILHTTDVAPDWGLFDENGVFQEEKQGLYTVGTDTYYLVDGICTYAKLVYVNGQYYYINSSLKAVKNRTYWFTNTNADIFQTEAFNGSFDEYGRLTNVPEGTVLPYLPGDASGDGETNNLDIMVLSSGLVGGDTAANAAACDVNGDGEVNNLDLLIMARFCAGWTNTTVGQGGVF